MKKKKGNKVNNREKFNAQSRTAYELKKSKIEKTPPPPKISPQEYSPLQEKLEILVENPEDEIKDKKEIIIILHKKR